MPRKLGQHFLHDQTILERLAEAACPEHTARVVEVGSGRGALTRRLLPRTDELHCIELDRNLALYLQEEFKNEPKLHVHEADVLGTPLDQWGPAAITGNLPYYITSPIIERFLRLDGRFPTAVFLMQWEVAQRIVARPSTRDYGYLTVASQLVCDVDVVCKVPARAFSPAPKVESAAVRFCRKPSVPSELGSILKLVGRCFALKRKTLRNNLRPFYGALADTLPEARLRAEQLSIDQFVDLYQRLSAAPRLSYTEIS